MGLALEGPQENDQMFEQDDMSFAVDSTLLRNSDGLKLDTAYVGFVVYCGLKRGRRCNVMNTIVPIE